MKKKVSVLLSVLMVVSMLMAAVPVVSAAPPAQDKGQDYVVVKDDWLSKLADKYLGNALSYPAIVGVTNQKAATDSSYTKIANADQIEVGWKIYIPSAEEAKTYMTTYALPPTEPVELRVAWWGSQTRHDRTIKVIELFQQKYPNIKVSYEFALWDDYWVKMNTQAAGNNLPDVMQQDYQKIAEWVSKGLLMPLDPYIDSGAIDLRKVSPTTIKSGVLDGKNYGISLGNNTLCVEVDVDAFNKAGVPVPTDKWTWADFENAAMTIHDKLGIYGDADSLYNWELWRSIYLARGENIWSADGTQLGYTDDQPYADFLKMAVRLQQAKAIPTREEEIAANWTLENNPFVKGDAAMTWLWTNQIVGSLNAAGEGRNIKIVNLPVPAGAKTGSHYMKPSMFFSISANTKHPKEAGLFIDFFTNSIEANQILLAERGVPISSDVREGIKPQLGPAQVTMFDFAAAAEKSAAPTPPADPAGASEVSGSNNSFIVTSVIEPVFYGKLSPEEAVALLRQQANAILGKNKK
jgi:multiple sugar transport system substrate-binding protein